MNDFRQIPERTKPASGVDSRRSALLALNQSSQSIDRPKVIDIQVLIVNHDAEYESIIQRLGEPSAGGKAEAFARLGALAMKADAYDPLPAQSNMVEGQGNQFHGVLQEAIEMRKSGELLALAEGIECSVVAIHGDYDPHPLAGVQEPLSAALVDFRLILLKRCGHKPWVERQAKDSFYQVLGDELSGL